MLAFAHFVELAFLPCLATALAIGVAWRFSENRGVRTALQVLGALLLFVPQLFVLFLGAYSARLRLYQQALFSLWALGIAALVFARRTSRAGTVTRATVALVMAIAGAVCAWNVVGDYVLERDVISGRVEGMRVVHHRRSPDSYEVLIARQAHNIPYELAVALHPGDDVEAQVGAASGTILAIHKLP
jgi:hypothetical protein